MMASGGNCIWLIFPCSSYLFAINSINFKANVMYCSSTNQPTPKNNNIMQEKLNIFLFLFFLKKMYCIFSIFESYLWIIIVVFAAIKIFLWFGHIVLLSHRSFCIIICCFCCLCVCCVHFLQFSGEGRFGEETMNVCQRHCVCSFCEISLGCASNINNYKKWDHIYQIFSKCI